MLLIGSVALRICGLANHYAKIASDIDVICTPDEHSRIAAAGAPIPGTRAFRVGAHIIDPEVARPGTSAADYIALPHDASRLVFEDSRIGIDVLGQMNVASVQVLYSLKRSHRHKPTKWHRHIRDYHALKVDVGPAGDAYPEITAKREAETAKRKHISLKRTVNEFFDDDVSNQVFVHDHIHEAVAHREWPMFHYIRVAEDRVTCDKAKWNALDLSGQIDCVLEEAYVIALERGIIPWLFQGKQPATAESAFQWAMMRICTTLTSGWFRDFATENYPAINARANMLYPERFFAAVDRGEVKRISHSVQ